MRDSSWGNPHSDTFFTMSPWPILTPNRRGYTLYGRWADLRDSSQMADPPPSPQSWGNGSDKEEETPDLPPIPELPRAPKLNPRLPKIAKPETEDKAEQYRNMGIAYTVP